MPRAAAAQPARARADSLPIEHQRSAHLQSDPGHRRRLGRGGRRSLRGAGQDQSDNDAARAGSGRELGDWRRRQDDHVSSAPRREMVRRAAVHRARRGLHDARDLRPARSQYRGAQPHRRRQAAQGRGARRLHGADDDAASVRAVALLDRRPDDARAPPRDRAGGRQVQSHLGHQHAAGKNCRPRPVRDGALRAGAVRPLQAQSELLDARREGRAAAAPARRDAANRARRQRRSTCAF